MYVRVRVRVRIDCGCLVCVVLASISLPGAVAYRFCEEWVRCSGSFFLRALIKLRSHVIQSRLFIQRRPLRCQPTRPSGAGARGARKRNDAPRNGFDVTDAVFNVSSSIRRLFEHHMIPAEVCDGQDPVRSTLYGRDIEINNAPGTRGPETLRVTVLTLLTQYSMSVRRSGGYLSTTWYQPRCVMVRTRPDRRHGHAISIQRSRRPRGQTHSA